MTDSEQRKGLEVLLRFCPSGSPLRVVGEESDEAARALAAAGYEVTAAEGEERALVVASSQARSPSEIAAWLDELRKGLAPRGLLVLVARLAWGEGAEADALPAAELLAQTYERGFVLLARSVLAGEEERPGVPPLRSDGPTRREALVLRREPYRVRGFSAGDEEPIQELFHGAFPHERRSLPAWLWKYRDHPAGGPFISLAVDDDDRIGAHYGAYPVFFEDCEGEGPRRRSLRAFQIGDTMSAAWARAIGGRRTSLLARATQHFFHRHCAHQVGFNYGFNTGKIHRWYLRLVPGSELLEKVPYRVLDLGEGLPAAPGFWDRWVRGLEVERVAAVDGEWDELFERVAGAYGLLAERRAEQVAWRFLDRPDRDDLLLALRRHGRLVGWGAFRRQGDDLAWGDALVDPEEIEALPYLLRAALEEDEGRDARRIVGWFPDRPSFLSEALAGLGFELRAEPNDLAMIFMEFEERDLAARFAARLYYTWADSDLF